MPDNDKTRCHPLRDHRVRKRFEELRKRHVIYLEAFMNVASCPFDW